MKFSGKGITTNGLPSSDNHLVLLVIYPEFYHFHLSQFLSIINISIAICYFLQGLKHVKLERAECDDPSIQQLSSERSLIEIARRSNPVVVVERLDMDRYCDILVNFSHQSH